MSDAHATCLLLLAVVVSVVPGVVRGADEFERLPIEYSKSVPSNDVQRLQEALKAGETDLAFDEKLGYLPALLRSLRVPVESQVLVFSKTSMQRNRITARTPRALYFNDDVYVGYCQAGNSLEISVADPALGAVYYTLDQQRRDSPRLERQTHQCLLCHSSSQTGQIPSHLLRSVFADASGLPALSEGSFRVDYTTPLEQRWGGWYVSGTHGKQTHLGNFIVEKTPLERPIKNAAGLNVVDLSDRLPVHRYLTPHSDLVALMVLEHQTAIHNLITKANFETRSALHYEAEFNRGLGEPAENRLESTTRRIASAGDLLVKGILFADEAPLTESLRGTSGYSEYFSALGPRDPQGRSLREFDLERRVFKYPCSFLVYSPAFAELPQEMKQYITLRLRAVLDPNHDVFAEADSSGGDVSGSRDSRENQQDFAHLSAADRQAILEILLATKPDVLQP